MLALILAGLSVAVLAGFAGAGAAPAAVGDNLLAGSNPGLENPADVALAPTSWNFTSWGTGMVATGSRSSEAHSGSYSAQVEITTYPTSGGGDAKWWPDPVDVTGGAYYTLSDWYESNITSAVSVEYWTEGQDTSQDGTWINLQARIEPASSWTHFETGFTMPPDAVKAIFTQAIAGVGWLRTDDYAMIENATPAGFGAPIVTLAFDDATSSYYDYARSMIAAKGFRTTLYVPTSMIGTPGYMTGDQLSTEAAYGDEIGSHSVTHPPDLTALDNAQLASELNGSKATLEAIPGVGTVTSFAYPFGYYDGRVIAAAQAAGYSSGRSVEPGFNNRTDLQPFDLRVQNMTNATTQEEFNSWIEYARAHNYWLILVYHRVVPDGTPACGGTVDPSVLCQGPYDVTTSQFQAQLDAITTAGLDSDVMPVNQAMGSIYPPTAGTVTLQPSAPTTNDTVTATPSGFSDTVGSPLTYVYTWKVNGAVVPGASGPTLDLAAAGHGDHGQTVSVDVAARDQWGNTGNAASAVVTVVNTAPHAGSVTITPSSPTAGTTLTATPSGFTDADGDTLSYQYTWLRDGQPISAATANTLTGSLAAAGTISVQVRALDGHGGTSDTATATVTVAAATAQPGGQQPPSGGQQPSPAVDKTPPAIALKSPTAPIFRVGKRVLLRFSITDTSGIAKQSATLQRIGTKAVKVHSGKRVRLTKTGRYVLRITATDRNGNAATKTVRFRVVNDRKGPTISVKSPRARTYHAGTNLRLKFSARDRSGIGALTATLTRKGSKAVKVHSGQRIRLTKTGKYLLRIKVKDRVGNRTIKAIHFTVR